MPQVLSAPMRKEVAAERNRLPTKALQTLVEDAHRPLGLPIACPFWTVQNIFSILTWMLARGEPRTYLCSVSGSCRYGTKTTSVGASAVEPPLRPIKTNLTV